MCFRPSDASATGPAACPSCGKKLQPIGGVPLKKCPFCHIDLTGPDVEAPGASRSPASPPAPKAPGAPKAG